MNTNEAKYNEAFETLEIFSPEWHRFQEAAENADASDVTPYEAEWYDIWALAYFV